MIYPLVPLKRLYPSFPAISLSIIPVESDGEFRISTSQWFEDKQSLLLLCSILAVLRFLIFIHFECDKNGELLRKVFTESIIVEN